MKQILSALLLISFLAVPAFSLAASCSDFTSKDACNENNKYGCTWNESKAECSGVYISEAQDLIDLIVTIGNWIFAGVLAIAAVFLIVAGFMFVTGGGSPEQVNKARTMLINALIGVAIALGARGLVAVVESILSA